MAQFSHHEDRRTTDAHNVPCTPDEEPRSSPGDLMDISPVPMIARRTFARASSMFEGKSGVSTSNSLPIRGQQARRPPLVSQKSFTSFAVPIVPERKAFSFGNTYRSSGDKENRLADQFEDSPKKTPRKIFNIGFARKMHDQSPSYADDSIERSPLAPISSNESNKRLPLFRRTQSMVTRNDEFLVPEMLQNTPTSRPQQQTPISPEQVLTTCQILPSFESKQDQLKRITGSTLARVLEGVYSDQYDKLEVIDCRFPHEYEGGHIPRAINVSSLDSMDRHPLLSNPQPLRTLIILHCEYSAHRAPRIALHLRSRDRMMNAHRYPKLFYPEIYILDGGYSNFYRDFRQHVGGSGYVEMNDPIHRPFASKQMHDFRKNTKFHRTQSYTFGQDSPLTGGARMERELTFKLHTSESAAGLLHNHQHSQGIQKRPLSNSISQKAEHDEGTEDCSMMDIDQVTTDSTVPIYADATNNTLQRTHARTASGRLDPRRLCSF